MAKSILEWDELNLIRESVPDFVRDYRQSRNPETRIIPNGLKNARHQKVSKFPRKSSKS